MALSFSAPTVTNCQIEIELEIEALLDQPLVTNGSNYLGKARRITDAAGRYVEFCKGSLPSGLTCRE